MVDIAHHGIGGLHLASEDTYDLLVLVLVLVLDSMWPGIDGLALPAASRQSEQTPLLMLTARLQVLLRRAAPSQAAEEPTVVGWVIWPSICCAASPFERASARMQRQGIQRAAAHRSRHGPRS